MQYKHIHFTGIGGVGMTALAHIVLDMGCSVSGSDIAPSANIDALRKRGADIVIGHGTVPKETQLLVYSSAVPASDTERLQAKESAIPQMRRGDFLNLLAEDFPIRVAVSGSHGKTSTSAMIAHILKCCGMNPGFCVGGAVNGWERPAAAGDLSILVTEVDESDGTQARFPATHAIVLNIDDDHSWALGGTEALEQCFISLCQNAQHIIAWKSEATQRLFGHKANCLLLDQPISAEGLYGTHTKSNAAVAVKLCTLLGIDEAQTIAALASFPGVSRRLSERYRTPDDSIVLVEDYAHHPTELEATLQTLAEKYPNRKILAVFQPHRMERVERYGARFASALSKCAWVGLVETFGAWRQDNLHADLKTLLLDKINAPAILLPQSPDEIAATAAAASKNLAPAVLAVIGAGDITKCIIPLTRILEH